MLTLKEIYSQSWSHICSMFWKSIIIIWSIRPNHQPFCNTWNYCIDLSHIYGDLYWVWVVDINVPRYFCREIILNWHSIKSYLPKVKERRLKIFWAQRISNNYEKKILKWNNLRGKIKIVQSKKWTSPIDDQDLNPGVVPVAPQNYVL